MRSLLLAGVVAIAGIAVVAPASAQLYVDTPVGGVRVGDRDHYRDRDHRRGYRAYGYDRDYRNRGGCRTVTIERDDGSVKRIKRCN
jgi:hypothetical protein